MAGFIPGGWEFSGGDEPRRSHGVELEQFLLMFEQFPAGVADPRLEVLELAQSLAELAVVLLFLDGDPPLLRRDRLRPAGERAGLVGERPRLLRMLLVRFLHVG